MRSQLLWCLMANILATLLSVSVLYLYPAGRGFTFTSGATTHFVQGGPLIAALLMICVSIVIAVYLTFRVYAAAVGNGAGGSM
jgi:hypothetical protein